MVLVREKSGKSQGILISHLCGNPEKEKQSNYYMFSGGSCSGSKIITIQLC